ncbi:MAG: hypothetical protein LWW93_16585 [Hyphomicrobiales bacterium]|nr:hypothetical protein [Hyphomicrobiales bacterium]
MPKTTWILAGLAAALAAAVVLWRDDRGRETIETSPAPVAVSVAGHELAVPMNAIRFPAQRSPGAQPRLDLALLGPDWSGRTAATADRFDEPAANSDVVWVTLTKAENGDESTTRLATVYARFFEGDPLDAPEDLGLVGRRLAAKSGYVGEEVWFEPGVVRPFVARCWPLAPNGPVVTCRAEETAAGLSIALRFPRARLASWRDLRTGVLARLAEWGVPAP